jgi:molecular chaperone GrpE
VGRDRLFSQVEDFEQVGLLISMANTDSEMTEATSGNEPLTTVEPANITPELLEELKERAAKAEEHWDRLLRLTADFDNFKKRAAREKQDAIKYANESLLEKLVPLLDNFEMALAAAQKAQGEEATQSLQTGVNMVYNQLKNVLAEAGLEVVDAMGQQFDPNRHEAVLQKETDEAPEGQVVQQLRRGYKLRERLLRAASVVVAKSPAS